MLRVSALCAFALIFGAHLAAGQEPSRITAPLPNIESSGTLSRTLLDFAHQSDFNVIADTTNNERSPDADLVANWPKTRKVAHALNKQSLIFDCFWNQLDANTVVVWHKPDIKTLALTVAQKWEQQTPTNPLTPEITRVLESIAQKIDETNVAERTSEKKIRMDFSQLAPEQQQLLLPLVLHAQLNEAIRYDQQWLTDEFWSRALIGNTRTGADNTWTFGALPDKDNRPSSVHGLAPQHTRSPLVYFDENALISAGANAQLGARIEGTLPNALTHPVSLTSENTPLGQTLKQLSQTCGVTIGLDDTLAPQLQVKCLTIVVKDLAPSAILRDVALLYDLNWKIEGEKMTAYANANAFQNAASKIGGFPVLETWNYQRLVTQPDFNSLFLQETTVAKARARDGISFGTLSPDLQAAVRNYNENLEIYNILETWQKSLQTLSPNVAVVLDLGSATQRRNALPLPDPAPTQEELRDPATQAEYMATFYESYRPFIVTIDGEGFNERFVFPNGILVPQNQPPKTPPVEGAAPTP